MPPDAYEPSQETDGTAPLAKWRRHSTGRDQSHGVLCCRLQAGPARCAPSSNFAPGSRPCIHPLCPPRKSYYAVRFTLFSVLCSSCHCHGLSPFFQKAGGSRALPLLVVCALDLHGRDGSICLTRIVLPCVQQSKVQVKVLTRESAIEPAREKWWLKKSKREI